MSPDGVLFPSSQILQSRQATDCSVTMRDPRLSQKLRLSSPQMPRCRAAPPRMGAVLATDSAWHGVSGIPDGSTGAGSGCLSRFHPRKFLCKDQESLFFHSIALSKDRLCPSLCRPIPTQISPRNERQKQSSKYAINLRRPGHDQTVKPSLRTTHPAHHEEEDEEFQTACLGYPTNTPDEFTKTGSKQARMHMKKNKQKT